MQYMEDDPNITYISADAYAAMVADDDQQVPEAFVKRVKELRAKFLAP